MKWSLTKTKTYLTVLKKRVDQFHEMFTNQDKSIFDRFQEEGLDAREIFEIFFFGNFDHFEFFFFFF